MASKDNDLCQLLNRWTDSTSFSQWQNILLSVPHASCSPYTLQLVGNRGVWKIWPWQKRIWFQPDSMLPAKPALLSAPWSRSLGTPLANLTLFRRLQSRCTQCFTLQRRGFCFRTQADASSLLPGWKWLKVWDVNYPCRRHTELCLNFSVTQNECKVNYHPYMICMVVKVHC